MPRSKTDVASPQFPRLTNPDALKETISRGVGNGLLAYIGKTASDDYKPFYFSQALMTADVELFQDAGLVKRFSGNPDVQKARAKFDRAQKVEKRFHRDFDGVDFTKR